MKPSRLKALDLGHVGEVVSVTGERRTVLRITDRSVWYLTKSGRPKQCSAQNWILWKTGKPKGGAE